MLQVRLSQLKVDPDEQDECALYVEREARLALADQEGMMGLTLLAGREAGVLLLGSFWVSREWLSASAEAHRQLGASLARRAGAVVAAGDYEVAVFERERPLQAGQEVRLTRVRVKPLSAYEVVDVYGDSVVPDLAETPGTCGALLLVAPDSGLNISETVWRDARARDSCPDVGAVIRSNVLDRDSCEVDPPEDYRLAASTVIVPFDH